jgi:lysophospholipase L1-like esterase
MIKLEEDISLPEEVAWFDPGEASDKFRVVAMGDSITQCGGMRREERWTGILEDLLGPDCQVVNAGIGGTSSSLGLYRWRRDVSPINPHAMVICFLLNDSHIRHYECSSSYSVQCTPQRMEANMRAMFDLSEALGARPVLWTPPPVPTWGPIDARMGVQMELLEFYEVVLERVCRDREVPLVNNWRTFPSKVEEYPGRYFNEPDGYHSTVHAQPMLAQGIRDALEEPLQAYRKG